MYCTTNKLTLDISLIRAVTALLRECNTLNEAVIALFTSKAASPNKAVILPWHTTALLRDTYYFMSIWRQKYLL